MAHPCNAILAGIVVACVSSVIPAATFAQGFDTAPSGSFTFGSFGAAQVDDLPLELSEDSAQPAIRPLPQLPTTVIELGTSPVVADVQTVRVQPRRIQNTWSIGVFR